MEKLFIYVLFSFMLLNCVNHKSDRMENIDKLDLFECVLTNDIKRAEHILKQEVNVDIINAEGETPLLKATQQNRVAIAKLLMKAGANINKQDNIKDSPFLYACAEGRTEILEEMLKYNPDVHLVNRYGGNGLIPAAEKGHLENVKLLLEHTNMDVNLINNLGWTALLEAIILTKGGAVHQAIMKELITHNADVNIRDKDGVSPLEHARRKGYKKIEKILLEAGAKP